MADKSKWIVCAKPNGKDHWRILGYIEPQPDAVRLRRKISKKYSGWDNYGIWVVTENVVIRSEHAPSKEVTTIARMFKTNDFVKGYSDILEGMEFVENYTEGKDEKNLRSLRVLATREGFCMIVHEGDKPTVMHWKKLVSQYTPKPNQQ